jgi:hypothetical protein
MTLQATGHHIFEPLLLCQLYNKEFIVYTIWKELLHQAFDMDFGFFNGKNFLGVECGHSSLIFPGSVKTPIWIRTYRYNKVCGGRRMEKRNYKT